MSIHLAVAILVYVMLLVLAYEIVLFTNLEEEESDEIIHKSFRNALSILVYGLLIVYGLLVIPHITLDHQTTSYLILTSKFVSVLTLGISLFLLSRKKYEEK